MFLKIFDMSEKTDVGNIFYGRLKMFPDLTDPTEFRHPEEELPELAGHLRVVGHGVLLQGVHHLLLTSSHCIRVLQPTRVYIDLEIFIYLLFKLKLITYIYLLCYIVLT